MCAAEGKLPGLAAGQRLLPGTDTNSGPASLTPMTKVGCPSSVGFFLKELVEHYIIPLLA